MVQAAEEKRPDRNIQIVQAAEEKRPDRNIQIVQAAEESVPTVTFKSFRPQKKASRP
jgi:hypothetical protein